ncbi:MAG: regulatory protein RecX [Clostridia bacterium]|nr:regulatory protein RecX [Clostridia bacterium]
MKEFEKNKSEPKKDGVSEVMNAASNILVFADNTEKSLREKLMRKGFAPELVDKAVERLKEAGLVNDARLMKSYTEYLADKKLYGKARIKLELQKKGFDRELINGKFDECTEDVDFKENCVKMVRKKNLVQKICDTKTARAVTAALARYGYGYAEIKYAYTRLLEENEEE